MVVVASATPNPRSSSNQSPARSASFSSEVDNGVCRRPRAREITSRYMSSLSSTSSSSSSGIPSISRRSASPSRTNMISLSSTAIPNVSSVKRSHSVGRRGPSTPRASAVHNKSSDDSMKASNVLYTSTRSLSVSFQGEPFSLHVSKSKPSSSPSPTPRKTVPERRRTPVRQCRSDASGGTDIAENTRTIDHSRWPGTSRQSDSASRNLDSKNELIKSRNLDKVPRRSLIDETPKSLAANRSRSNHEFLEFGKRTLVSASNLAPISTDAFDSLVSDSESVSSGSTSGRTEITCSSNVDDRDNTVFHSKFHQDTTSYLKNLSQSSSPLSRYNATKITSSAKIIFPRKVANDTLVSYPKSVSVLKGSSTPVGHSQPVSPIKIPMASSFSPRRFPSPSRVGSISNMMNYNKCSSPFALNSPTDVRRGKVLENRINDAHVLRLLYSRHIQWRFVNARGSTARSIQAATAEKFLFNASSSTSRLFDLVGIKRKELQLQRLNLKLLSILKGQVLYLEEWDSLERSLFNSLRGAAEAITAGTLRLPVVSGATADVQHLEDAIFSSVEVMQTLVSSAYSYLSKVNKVHSLVGNLVNMRRKEQILLAQCRLVLSTISTIQVTDCSLTAQLLRHP